MSNSTHNIVVLGSSYAGIGVAHGVLKALPGLKSSTKKDYKVTMISNSTHFWWSVGAPRAMLKPYPKDNMDSFLPVVKGFETYAPGLYEFVHAEITGVETESREVVYKLKDNAEHVASDAKKLHFDTLVIATGSTGESPLYALQGSHLPTLNAYKDVQTRLPSAKSVVVIGGGAAGVETAGELGELHGTKTSSSKDITILSGGERLLPALRPSIGKRAQEILEGFGVKVEHNLRLKNSKTTADGQTAITFDDGSTRTVDLLLVATGRKPASSSLPASILTSDGRVTVDEYQRIPNIDSAYACGDVTTSSQNPGGIIHLQTAIPTTAGNIIAELGGKGKGKVFKPMTTKETQFVPVGSNGGVGAMFGWWAPSFLIKQVKSKNFMFPKAQQTLEGKA
ncbi:hypothetical protein ACLMJK_004515 [Lecanora helva]